MLKTLAMIRELHSYLNAPRKRAIFSKRNGHCISTSVINTFVLKCQDTTLSPIVWEVRCRYFNIIDTFIHREHVRQNTLVWSGQRSQKN